MYIFKSILANKIDAAIEELTPMLKIFIDIKYKICKVIKLCSCDLLFN